MTEGNKRTNADGAGERERWVRGARAFWYPLRERYGGGGARLCLGPARASYSVRGIELEAWARQLWYLVPLAVNGEIPEEAAAIYLDGLRHGPDPEHPEFWGFPEDRDQRFVEMASIAFALLLAPATFLDPLEPAERERLARWLALVNTHELHDNNWLWWRVMVQMALEKLGYPTDWALAEKDLDRLESFYGEGGYYRDGKLDTVDYYNPWTLHFYPLLYIGLRSGADPERCRRFAERARAFAPRYARWFAAGGEAVPYGRSMIYRPGQGAFWAALAWSGLEIEGFGPGVQKGFLLRNLRHWERAALFDASGALTLGYAYPQIFLTESYNAPGSPYWGLMSYLFLALPEDHPFWRSEEAPMPERPPAEAQPAANRIYTDIEGGRDVHQITGGHDNWMDNAFDKYQKFAYSARLGFAVGSGGEDLGFAAPDNHLLLRRPGEPWVRHRETLECRVEEGRIRIHWRPMPEVEVRTELIVEDGGHRRIHKISTPFSLETAEGGFAVAADPEAPVLRAAAEIPSEGGLCLRSEGEFSQIRDAGGVREAVSVGLRPGTHLVFPRAVVPVLLRRIEAGSTVLETEVAVGRDC